MHDDAEADQLPQAEQPGAGVRRDRHRAAAAGARCTSSTATTAGCASAPVGLQPSELAKPALVIFLAFFVAWRGRAINNPRHTLMPAALAVGFVIFAVVVADLGTAVVLGVAAMAVFFVAGLEWRYCGDRGGDRARRARRSRSTASRTGWRAWSTSSTRSSRS